MVSHYLDTRHLRVNGEARTVASEVELRGNPPPTERDGMHRGRTKNENVIYCHLLPASFGELS